MTGGSEERLRKIENDLILIKERLRIVWLLVISGVGLALTSIATALIASVVKGAG